MNARAAPRAADIPPSAGTDRWTLAAALGVAAALFVLYAKTACGAPYWQDAGLYFRSVYLLGNCYAPGYPSYLNATWLFTALPHLAAPYALNLASAVGGGAAAFFVALISLRLWRGSPYAAAGAAVAALALGTAPAVWAQATITEVYTLNLALAGATVLALLRWGGGDDRRPLYAAAFIYGLACGVHPIQAAFLPAYLVYVLWAGGRRIVTPAEGARLAVCFLLPLSTFLYLPIRSATGVLPDWGMTRHAGNFYKHVSGAAFHQDLFTAAPALVWARARLAADLFQQQFGWLGLGAGALGAAYMAARRPRAAALVFLAAAGALLFILNYVSANWRTWYTPLYLAWALALGGAVVWAAGWAGRRARAAGVALSLLAVAAAAAPVWWRFGPADRSYFPYAEDEARNLLRPMGPRASFIYSCEGGDIIGPLGILVTADRVRPDLRILDGIGTRQFEDFILGVDESIRFRNLVAPGPAYVAAFMKMVSPPGRDFYMVYPFGPAEEFGYRYELRALTYKLLRPGEQPSARDWWALYRRRGVTATEPAYVDSWTAGRYGVTYLNEAKCREAAGDYRGAARALAQAERFGARAETVQTYLGDYAANRGDYGAAEAHYRRAEALAVVALTPRLRLIRLYEHLGDADAAAREHAALRRLYPTERSDNF